MTRVLVSSLVLSALLPIVSFAQEPEAEEPAPQPGDLEKVQIAECLALPGLTRIAISPDGKFAYASAFSAGALVRFRRDADSGKLETISTLTAPLMRGVMNVRLSPEGSYLVAAAPSAASITVIKLNRDTGAFEEDTSATQGQDGNEGLSLVADAIFGADDKFVYTASFTGVGVYKRENDRLSFVQFETAGGKLNFVRNLATSADGNTIYALGYQSANLAVLRRNPADGKVSLVQLLSSHDEGCEGLSGAFRVCSSPDGKHVYVNSGRFGGAQGVSAFAVTNDGSLRPVGKHLEGETLEQFKGGNDIKTSPDGAFVYAVACETDRLFRFQRDAESGALIPAGSQTVGRITNPGAAGIAFSPDGKFVYIADEGSLSIVVLKVP